MRLIIETAQSKAAEQRSHLANIRSITAALFACGLLACLPATAQQAASSAQETPVLRVNARIVVLDVVVTDKQGHAITGLTRDDFTIYEDKSQQTIHTFEGPEQHRLPADVAIDSTADLAKAPNAPVTLLVLDELNTRFEDMSYARAELTKYLNTQPATLTQPTALIAATNTKFQLLRDYTLNRQSILAALNAHFPEYPWRLMNSGKTGPGAAERLAMSLGSLEQIAQATAGHPGRKNVIWVGRGFPAVNLQDATDPEAASIEAAVQHVTTVMRDSRITLTAIDPTANTSAIVDIETPEDLDIAQDANGSDPMAGGVSFQMLAPATGGRVYLSRNDIDTEIASTVRDGEEYYTLSYTPTGNSDAAATYRRIHVQMKNPALTATTRNGYYVSSAATPPTASPATLQLDLKKIAFDLGSAASSSIAYTGLAVHVHRNLPSDSFAIGVDAKGLTLQQQASGASRAEITLMVASFDRQNKMIAHIIQEQAQPVADDTVHFSISTAIPPAATRVRIVARDAVSGKMGSVDLTASQLQQP